jgi:aspartate/methionine/tyrosine aminotransferase
MRGTVRLPRATGRDLRDATDPELARRLARILRVAPYRVFLTHGATESNAWLTVFARRRARGRALRCRVRTPEYPPLFAAAEWAGFRVGAFPGRVPLAVVSQPRNPEGTTWSADEFDAWADGADCVIVDETFREFSTDASRAVRGDPRIWTTGSFTKAYGGDSIRVGWIVAPPDAAAEFARFHGIVTDEIAPASIAAAFAALRARRRILREVRSVVDRNRRVLAAALPGAAQIRGPVYFDRAPGEDGDRLTRRCLAASVLVCPGRFFGDPSGVRICLTQRTFPSDLRAYLRVRDARGHRSRR